MASLWVRSEKLKISLHGFCWISGRLGLRFGAEQTPPDRSGLVPRCVVDSSMPGSRCLDIVARRSSDASWEGYSSKMVSHRPLLLHERQRQAMRWHRTSRKAHKQKAGPWLAKLRGGAARVWSIAITRNHSLRRRAAALSSTPPADTHLPANAPPRKNSTFSHHHPCRRPASASPTP